MKYIVTVNGRDLEIWVDGDTVEIEGRSFPAELRQVPGSPLRHLVFGGGSTLLIMEPGDQGPGSWRVQDRGEVYEVTALDERTRHIRSLLGGSKAAASGATIKAPMPGLVVRIGVEPGQRVEAGAGLLVLEAMKMENELKAPVTGIVERIEVAPGQAVEKGALLVVIAAG